MMYNILLIHISCDGYITSLHGMAPNPSVRVAYITYSPCILLTAIMMNIKYDYIIT